MPEQDHELTQALARLGKGRVLVTAYKSVTLSPKAQVFSITIQQGITLQLEDGETIQEGQARANDLVDTVLWAEVERMKTLYVGDPSLRGEAEKTAAALQARPSNQDAHKATNQPAPRPTSHGEGTAAAEPAKTSPKPRPTPRPQGDPQ